MLKGIAGQIVLALLLITAAPLALQAQQSARVRARARIVHSAVPETNAATASELARLAETGIADATTETHSVATERGLAQITTERLTEGTDRVGQAVLAPSAVRDSESAPERVMITVAFTAN